MFGFQIGLDNMRRIIGGGTPIDPMAQAFIDAYGITDPTYISYVNAWALGVKGLLPGVNETYDYTSMLEFLLIIVPQSVAVVRGDLLTATSKPAPVGGWTLSNDGFKSNGVDAEWDLDVNPSSAFADEKYGFGLYNTLDLTTHGATQNYVLGCYNGGKITACALNYVESGISYFSVSDDVVANIVDTDGLGARIWVRSTTANIRIGKNGSTNNVAAGTVGANPNATTYAGKLAGINFGICRFASIYNPNQAWTIAEMNVFQDLDNYCQTILGRNQY